MFYYNYNRTFIIGKGAMLCYAMLFYGDDLGQVSWVVGVDVFVDREII
jgi:hypothetical protein